MARAPQDSYLNKEAILTVAIEAGATAIHPGYGLLAENAEFARMCRECGIVFVGPTPEVIERMGNKDMARICAREAQVPLAEGCDLLTSADQAEAEARRVGCPVLIKARAGGGGRGIRRVDSPEAARAAYQEAYGEALSAFGDGECYMEKFIEHAHHVEVQLLCDAHGNALAIGERECSVQRRNQKLLEESPSPSIRPDVREQMKAAAVRLAKTVGYTGVGTIEFLYTDDGRFYFMEMNTRLQVEHPVTEMVSGLEPREVAAALRRRRAPALWPGRRAHQRPRHRVPHQRRDPRLLALERQDRHAARPQRPLGAL